MTVANSKFGFAEFALIHGLLIRDSISSREIRRCKTLQNPRCTGGAYYFDGQKGWVKNWAGDGQTYWYIGSPRASTAMEPIRPAVPPD